MTASAESRGFLPENTLKVGDIVYHDKGAYLGVPPKDMPRAEIGIVTALNESRAIDVYFYNPSEQRYKIHIRHWHYDLCTCIGSIYDFEDVNILSLWISDYKEQQS